MGTLLPITKHFSMNALQISRLSKTYPNGVKALDNISLTITDGMFGLLGPNGAGKSTLMRTLAGLQAPDSGSVFFNGQNILAKPDTVKQHLGYLPQDFGVYPHLSALDLLDHLAVLKGIAHKHDRKQQVMSVLAKTNLLDHRKKSVHGFSGGMRQRFGIAQALLGNPQLIIVDEPTAGLDPEERNRFNNLLSEIGEQVIVILSTHLVDDVKNLCTRMAIINEGRLLATGAPAAFLAQLAGRVWTKTIHKQELPAYRENYQLISINLVAGQMSITVISDSEPGDGFHPKTADLEDVYFVEIKNQVTHV